MSDIIFYIFIGLIGLVAIIMMASIIKDIFGGSTKKDEPRMEAPAAIQQQQAQPQPQIIYYCYGYMPTMAPGQPPMPMAQPMPAAQPAPVQEQPAPAPAPEAPKEEPKKEEVVAPAPAPVQEEEKKEEIEQKDDFFVKFNPSDNSLEAKYNQLSKEDKAYYDEVRDYAQSIESSKTFKNTRYEEMKIGMRRLVRLQIKRGHVQAEFIILRQDVIGLMNDSEVEMKIAPMVIKLLSKDDVLAAKKSIDVAYNAILEEKAHKKELMKQKRKQGKEANA